MKVILASRNAGKAAEFQRLLRSAVRVEPLPESIVLPEETGSTFAENAELKAGAAYGALGGDSAVLADDSGLEVPALGGQPGVCSARFAGERAGDAANVDKLLRLMSGVEDRGARFVCHLVLLLPPRGQIPSQIVRAAGHLEGTISRQPRGAEGFGYDPVFVPTGWSRTLAEVAGERKDEVSHRAAAVAALRRELSARGLILRHGGEEERGGFSR
jgi:XTP/dITP diphosphohydrolase